MNHLAPKRNFQMTDIEMVSMWQEVFKMGAIKDMEAFERIYSEDIVKFDTFLQEMDKKYNK